MCVSLIVRSPTQKCPCSTLNAYSGDVVLDPLPPNEEEEDDVGAVNELPSYDAESHLVYFSCAHHLTRTPLLLGGEAWRCNGRPGRRVPLLLTEDGRTVRSASPRVSVNHWCMYHSLYSSRVQPGRWVLLRSSSLPQAGFVSARVCVVGSGVCAPQCIKVLALHVFACACARAVCVCVCLCCPCLPVCPYVSTVCRYYLCVSVSASVCLCLFGYVCLCVCVCVCVSTRIPMPCIHVLRMYIWCFSTRSFALCDKQVLSW